MSKGKYFSRIFAVFYGFYDTIICYHFRGKVGAGDILCEMRFHVPNTEFDMYLEEKEN